MTSNLTTTRCISKNTPNYSRPKRLSWRLSVTRRHRHRRPLHRCRVAVRGCRGVEHLDTAASSGFSGTGSVEPVTALSNVALPYYQWRDGVTRLFKRLWCWLGHHRPGVPCDICGFWTYHPPPVCSRCGRRDLNCWITYPGGQVECGACHWSDKALAARNPTT